MECCKKAYFFGLKNYTIVRISPHSFVSMAQKRVFMRFRVNIHLMRFCCGICGRDWSQYRKGNVNQMHRLRLHWTSNWLTQVVGFYIELHSFICYSQLITHLFELPLFSYTFYVSFYVILWLRYEKYFLVVMQCKINKKTTTTLLT